MSNVQQKPRRRRVRRTADSEADFVPTPVRREDEEECMHGVDLAYPCAQCDKVVALKVFRANLREAKAAEAAAAKDAEG